MKNIELELQEFRYKYLNEIYKYLNNAKNSSNPVGIRMNERNKENTKKFRFYHHKRGARINRLMHRRE
jgi:hypothetical protein